MLETLICPSCAAPLQISVADGQTIQCPYCHTTVLRDGHLPSKTEQPAVYKPSPRFKLAIVAAVLVCAMIAVLLSMVQYHLAMTAPDLPAAPVKPSFAGMSLQFGSKGITPGHFDDASHIALDQQGHIYVGEHTNGRVQVFDKTGKYVSEFLAGPFDDFLADRQGTLYVITGGSISRFNGADGAKLPDMERPNETFATQQTPVYYRCGCVSAGVLHTITGYAVDVPRVLNLNTATGQVQSTTALTPPQGEMLNLHAILLLPTGEIYALDTEKDLVFRFSPTGAYVNRFGGTGEDAVSPDAPPSQLQAPSSMAFDSQGRIYIAGGGGIKVYDREGNFIEGIFETESANGIAIDEQDHIYACFRNCVREYVLRKQ